MLRKSFYLLAMICFCACAPAANPILQKKINTYYSQSFDKTYKTSKKFTSLMPYAVGQSIVTGTTDKDGKRSISRTVIVGKEKGGWIIETQSLTPSNESATQMLVTGMEKTCKTGDMDNLDILWVKIKTEDGSVQTIEGPALSFTKTLYRKMLPNISVSNAMIPETNPISVPAGHFIGTSKSSSTVSFLGSTYTSENWLFPGVPITGLVKSISKENNMTTELLNFSLKGAQSNF